MPSRPDLLPGFLAVSADEEAIARALPEAELDTASCGPVTVAYWGLDPLDDAPLALALSPVVRTTEGAIAASTVTEWMHRDPTALTRLLPPFAAVSGCASGIVMAADSMGFRQVYHTTPGALGPSALATSAVQAARAHRSELDNAAVAVQSLLGWQLGQRTLFIGVEKLGPGVVARLTGDGVNLEQPPAPDETPMPLQEAVSTAATLLRRSLEGVLDDHPDAVLQLTGGQDSRLLLSAIPKERRRGLRAMTLGVSGGDVAVASELAQRYGLQHETHDLTGLDDISPDQAWELTHTAALKLDGMADPIALAALTVGESSFEQGVRISGLGGEVARGFYYVGRVRERPVTKAEATRLAAWRMFANEAVEVELLDEEFSRWARDTANNEVFDALKDSGKDWDRATDDLYLRHRMQRWAGVTDTAVAYQRVVINPMLDPDFLNIAQRLSPADKANSLFLARLQLALDPELARIPLEGRPAPMTYATPSIVHNVTRRLSTGRRLFSKAVQRLHRGSRPPAGGDILAEKVVMHWRQHPDLLSAAAQLEVVRSAWVDGVLEGTVQPRPGSVAFLANLVVAAEVSRP